MVDISFGSEPRRIRCFNVKYSPNLGDGLLSECLEKALVRQGAAQKTASIDLAGRQTYGEGMAGRGAAMAVLDALPDRVRSLVVRMPLALKSRRSWAPHYQRNLVDAQAVAIGGGNLLSDHDLNFPTKLALALRTAADHRLPCAIYACGMADAWSAEGERRLRHALELAPLRAAFLRDEVSANRWNTRFGAVSGVSAKIVWDPGLLASRTYFPPAPKGQPAIGLGLMSHLAIRYHGTTQLDARSLGTWYVEVTQALVRRGWRVIAFTNGAPEDVAMADTLVPALTAASAEMRHRPRTPAELAATVANCVAIAAFRMHAVIAAYSFAVPALALAWDDKLAAFMASIDRLDWLSDVAEITPEAAAARLIEAAEVGVDLNERNRVIAEAEQDVSRLYAALSASS